jgi:hypothetical protein
LYYCDSAEAPQPRASRYSDFRVLFRETATEVIVPDIGPRGSIYD